MLICYYCSNTGTLISPNKCNQLNIHEATFGVGVDLINKILKRSFLYKIKFDQLENTGFNLCKPLCNPNGHRLKFAGQHFFDKSHVGGRASEPENTGFAMRDLNFYLSTLVTGKGLNQIFVVFRISCSYLL